MYAKRPWTRAKVDGGANKGPPHTPPGSKSVARWWRSRDKPQCSDTPIEEITNFLLKATLWANVLRIFSQAPAHRRPLDDGETSSLGSDVWLLIMNAHTWCLRNKNSFKSKTVPPQNKARRDLNPLLRF